MKNAKNKIHTRTSSVIPTKFIFSLNTIKPVCEEIAEIVCNEYWRLLK